MTATDTRPIVLVDMDSVLYDFDTIALADLPKDIREKYENGPFLHVQKRFPEEWHEAILNVISQPGFFLRLPLMPGAIEAWKSMIRHGFHPIVCSAPTRRNEASVQDKMSALERDFVPIFGNVITREAIIDKQKWNYHGAVLIDDRPNANKGHDTSWKQVLYSRPHNAHIRADFRLNSWENPEENVIPLLQKICEEK